MNRCYYKLYDSVTQKLRRCKKSRCYNDFCWNHANLKLYDKVVKIQSVWRSYKVRRKVNNIVKKLSEDVRNVILHYVKKEYYDDLKDALYFFYMYVNRYRKIEKDIDNLFTRYMNYELSYNAYISLVEYEEIEYEKALNFSTKLAPKVRLLVDI